MSDALNSDGYTVTPELVTEIKSSLAALGLPTTIFKVVFGNIEIIIRPLYREPDWLNFQNFLKDNSGNNDRKFRDAIAYKVCQLGVVWPAELLNPLRWNLLPAGLQNLVSNSIFKCSYIFDDEPDQAPEVELIGSAPDTVEPTPEELELLATKYPQWLGLLKQVIILNYAFVVRPINRIEWRAIAGKPQIELEDSLVKAATVWADNTDFDSLPAGVVTALSSVIFESCGFSNEPVVLEL